MGTRLVATFKVRYRWLGTMSAVAALAVVAAGCGGGGSSALSGNSAGSGATTTTTPTAKKSPSTTTTSQAASSGKQIHFTVTNSDGWQYSGSVPLPKYTFKYSSDISAAPPGNAAIRVSISGPAIGTMDFSDVNAGRPDGPQLAVAPGVFAFPISGALANDSFGQLTFGACGLAGNAGTDYDFEPFDVEVDCAPGSGTGPSSGTSSTYTDQSSIDALVALLDSEQPTYVINFAPPEAECNIFISPTGTVTDVPGSGGCGATVTVSP